MCGIAGVVRAGGLQGAFELTERILDSQHRRGPDHRAVEIWSEGAVRVVLGHNRLSIVDLSAGANQPMWDGDKRVCVVHNGEVYNYLELREELAARGHRFRTRSDTEVILEAFKAWGPGAFERFQGMFAFALLDVPGDRLYLVRDRFGVKPLFWADTGDGVAFASTPEVIARDLGLVPDRSYVARGIRYGIYDGGEDSPFLGVQALPPGSYLELRASDSRSIQTTLRPYYDLAARVVATREVLTGQSVPLLRQRVADLLESAVDVRFRADVPVAISLSGGLDSSAVAALAARRRGELVAFCFGDPEDPRSEAPLARELCRRLGLRLHCVSPEPASLADAYVETLAAQGAPFFSPSVIAQFLVYRAARAAGFKVLLGGQGGDEVFMGYPKFHAFYAHRLWTEGRHFAAALAAGGLVRRLGSDWTRAAAIWRHRQRYLRADGMAAALRLPDSPPIPLGYDAAQPLWKRQLLDVTRTSLPTLLRYEDRNSMANSIESRLPFMDVRLVEVALALPDAVKIRHGFGKWIVRQVVEGVVPDAIRLARYKRGFDVEQAAWIDAGLGRRVRQALLGRERAMRKWLRPGERIEVAFSDRALKRRPTAFAEATTLLWLADVPDPDGLPGGEDASAGGVLPGRIAAARDGAIGTIP